MKATLHSSTKGSALLMCFVFSLLATNAIAQTANTTASSNDIWYYLLSGSIIIVLIAMVLVMQKAALVLGENGQSLFEFDFPIFKRMTESDKTVAVVMALIVLLGIYFVVTYGMG